jgi:hypothetical protein
MNWLQRLKRRPFMIRLLHWEYWSFNVIYLPIYIVWVGLCLRARSFFFFAAANPRIKNGGFLNESKKDIHALVPGDLHPSTVFFSIPANAEMVIQEIRSRGLQFPLIGKPDIGARGRGIKALKDEDDVKEYVRNAFLDFHIQEFVCYKNEVGIFYYRYPNQPTGNISGIVRKEFLSVKGDGSSTIGDLLRKDERAILQIKNLEKTNAGLLHHVLPEGEERVVVPYGNHARGAKFLDDSHLTDEALTITIDKLCQRIPDFHFGRLDIRFNTWEELKQGKHFSVIEVNGAGSEPTHIYDPRHSIFFAWKEIIRHWFILWRISRLNHQKGFPYLNLKKGIEMFREDRQYSQKLAAMVV